MPRLEPTVTLTPAWIASHRNCEHFDGVCRHNDPNFIGCTLFTSKPGAVPITQCGKKGKHRIWSSLPASYTEAEYAVLCSEAHLAEEVRLVALHEVCNFRVERYI